MSRKLVLILVAFVFVLSASFAWAQEDDVFGLTGTANGEFPATLAPDTEYSFAFDVFNSGGGDEAIKEVAITLPSMAYAIGEYLDEIPGVNTPEYVWQANFDEETSTMYWLATGATSSATTGDIGEGDMLTFSFYATTDADATDGFTYKLYGDAAKTVVEGIWFFGETGDDDAVDDDAADDDDTADVDDDEDDDDDDGGCGC
ncbi:MAG: hypothetical protein P9L99_18015 [Candidatus Lernaella stagnicola]|nr:hypothetical protein [Candidatus Lernaella stagnicola]